MSIRLFCLVKGDTFENAFLVDVEKDQPVVHLKDAIKAKKPNDFAGVDADKLKLWKVEIGGDQDDQLENLELNDSDKLSALDDIKDYWPTSPPKKHIHIIIKLPLLSLEEVLSCIPPSAYYPSDTCLSLSSTNVGGVWPTKITRWEEFLNNVIHHKFDDKIQRFNRPKFLENKDSDFPRNDPTIGLFVPDYTCRLINNETYGIPILALEIKRDILLQRFLYFTDSDLEEFGKRKLSAGYVYDIIGQIYNYMSSLQLQYGILSSYDNHWFLYRPKNNNTELRISHPLARDSTKPPVLKSYAYLAWIAQQDPISPSHNSNRRQTFALQQGQQNSGSGQLSRSLSNPHHNLRSTSSDRENQDPTEKGFDCSEFKFECSLGNGQTGGTYRCKFYGQTIALKTLDLYKNGRFFDQMKKEIGIYKRLSKIQGKYIPELVCYGYYGGGMGYVMGMTIVGTMLNFHKIAKWQKNQALNALRIIHSHNILHNDIREENILVNDEGNIFFIDFGKSIITDKKKLFRKEESELSSLLNCYMNMQNNL
ncbi:uncharacterized protein OCT59_030178 [Rhizophagus irregularis]|uniref:uncharacterized protein n=1 Tax=Rhizophagus irregularis TaxID=588596 RepID=UPI0019FC35F6|nr:hypothetical protein OCT59_030178 [Rhizophagus irregularis]GBC53122.2 kinase-like domain-containing protein [Rhizophagus irregularis DAOM 181602=DAOM 197198]